MEKKTKSPETIRALPALFSGEIRDYKPCRLNSALFRSPGFSRKNPAQSSD